MQKKQITNYIIFVDPVHKLIALLNQKMIRKKNKLLYKNIKVNENQFRNVI